KGYVLATIGGGGRGGRLLGGEFRRLPARPMRVHELSGRASIEEELRAVVAALPPRALLQVRVPAGLAGAEVLRVARLRALCPPDVDVSVSFRGGRALSTARVAHAPRASLQGSTE
ncbi:MAG: hypothetical protein NDJ94_19180, partial [Vicinamibacteria bacterium]|nr:hypothetical protein [Vicinamibacteria bacterium]